MDTWDGCRSCRHRRSDRDLAHRAGYRRLLRFLRRAHDGALGQLPEGEAGARGEEEGEEDPVKALTIHQPWAQLIVHEAKRWETRTWAPPRSLLGQRFAVHAGQLDSDRVLAGLRDNVRRAIV